MGHLGKVLHQEVFGDPQDQLPTTTNFIPAKTRREGSFWKLQLDHLFRGKMFEVGCSSIFELVFATCIVAHT